MIYITDVLHTCSVHWTHAVVNSKHNAKCHGWLNATCQSSKLALFLCLHKQIAIFDQLGRHAGRGGCQECPNCVACKEYVEHVLCECASHDSQRQQILDHMKQILTPEAFEAFHHSSIFDNAAFRLRERQGMLVNDERTIVIKLGTP